jgi:hypothetical protein
MNNLLKSRQRTEQILLSLDKLGYLTTSQLQRLHNLKSYRNACRVIHNLSAFVHCYRVHENVYYLNKKGREHIGSTTIRTKTPLIHHILMRNDLYLYFGCPSEWSNEVSVSVGTLKIKPDVLFKKSQYYFVEIDYTQKMIANKRKIEKYRELKKTGAFQERYKHFPTLVWLTTTEHRKKQLRAFCDGLKVEVLTMEDIR